ncbi:GatB/YqeY domain-containing protein [Actinokineospora sp. NPDC004072]
MGQLKERLQADLTSAMKDRDKTRTATIRMALAALTTEEVAGDSARELTDAEVERVLTREVKKRKEAADAFRAAGRAQQADQELAEAAVLSDYLPKQLDDAELATLVEEAIAEVTTALGETPGPRQMGQVMKAATTKAAGRADGKRISAVVKSRLTG